MSSIWISLEYACALRALLKFLLLSSCARRLIDQSIDRCLQISKIKTTTYYSSRVRVITLSRLNARDRATVSCYPSRENYDAVQELFLFFSFLFRHFSNIDGIIDDVNRLAAFIHGKAELHKIIHMHIIDSRNYRRRLWSSNIFVVHEVYNYVFAFFARVRTILQKYPII